MDFFCSAFFLSLGLRFLFGSASFFLGASLGARFLLRRPAQRYGARRQAKHDGYGQQASGKTRDHSFSLRRGDKRAPRQTPPHALEIAAFDPACQGNGPRKRPFNPALI